MKWDGPEMGQARSGTGHKWALARNGNVRHELGWAQNGTGIKWTDPKWNWPQMGHYGTKWDGHEMGRHEMVRHKMAGTK